MQRSLFVSLMLAGVLASPATSESADLPGHAGKNRTNTEPSPEVRLYPVADLVVPLPWTPSATGPIVDKTCAQGFRALEQHLRRVTGTDVWNDECSTKPYAKTLSLVVRQTPSVHQRIADELDRLRRELDVQVTLECHVITGPRVQIAALAKEFPGELGQFETEQLLKRTNESKTLNVVFSPKVTLFSRQTAQLNFDGRAIAVNADVSVANENRLVHLKVSEGLESGHDILGNLQVASVHDGRAVALRFEASRSGSIIPPAPDAVERLVVIKPRIIVQTEVEQSVMLMVTPRGRIQEEEEELLGVPTE